MAASLPAILGFAVIRTVSLRPQRASFLARLLASCRGDLATYGWGLLRDLRALGADPVAVWLGWSVVLGQLADAASTVTALAGSGAEANPLSAAVIGGWGVPGLLVEKAVIAAVVVFNMARLRGRSARALGVLATLIGLLAVVWNLHVIG
jgi:hypothetical protein